MDRKECDKFFEEWLRAYADHLHLVRQGSRLDLVRPAEPETPLSTQKTGKTPLHRKATTR
jgi:hypothetical protein